MSCTRLTISELFAADSELARLTRSAGLPVPASGTVVCCGHGAASHSGHTHSGMRAMRLVDMKAVAAASGTWCAVSRGAAYVWAGTQACAEEYSTAQPVSPVRHPPAQSPTRRSRSSTTARECLPQATTFVTMGNMMVMSSKADVQAHDRVRPGGNRSCICAPTPWDQAVRSSSDSTTQT